MGAKDRVYAAGRSRRKSRVRVTDNPLGLRIKKRCCGSAPRCVNCPVVYLRLERSGAWRRNDENLPRELKEARRR
ncbi:hypothetical protein [Corynebacterium otitidis]|uniref:Uncharacterized protein n=1 Tax=Corynebacterium otitidis ATCC 51513 TaxID=883169 RepID=K0YH15_9CORY|nr:hypothetical protein [Corynebacterium otitidis]EJZ82721.1 hypothetical protein HMPREF9719_00379 [Corynebacterium otitidis ATCC 51513]